jgi:hypothetical protein
MRTPDYAKHGFAVVAVVDDHPHGHQNMLLRERLVEIAGGRSRDGESHG